MQLGVDAPDQDDAITPRSTVAEFCDVPGLAEMHGHDAPSDLESVDEARDLESKILGDVARELESNSVDKMAKDIFSFYVCARWVPDKTFWQLARQELAAQIIDSTVNQDEKPGQAIAELYQTYKFVPMLCSQNFEVFQAKDNFDQTYFHRFKADVNRLSDWLKSAQKSLVGARLAEIDSIFCGDKPMNDCAAKLNYQDMMGKLTKWCPGWLCNPVATREDLWSSLESFFKSFDVQGKVESKDWDDEFKTWKSRFPFHSFIAKPEGWTGSKNSSPKADERFVVCFGKRIASEMHRRPAGQHILTDQNNVGCHGWWTAEQSGDMLRRITELWKPPTCQLATMTYTMKKEIMAKFQEMNEKLFDALPSMIHDEMLKGNVDGGYAFEDQLPKPFSRKEITINGKTFIDGMRVTSTVEDCLAFESTVVGDLKLCAFKIGSNSKNPDYGIIQIVDGSLSVVWDKDTEHRLFPTTPGKIKIMPIGWTSKKGFTGHVQDLVAGVGKIADRAKQMFDSMFNKKYTNLAGMMSGSVSKWAVCPIKSDADLTALDSHLGVEDAAFQDFSKEAYKKWTGFQKAIPGEACVATSSVLASSAREFEKTQACDLSELMADHVEKYTKDDSTKEQEQFICPIRPPLPADEQLAILQSKTGTCFLRMTEEQQQQHSWHYQGNFPARRQYDRKENLPQPEFELVKLLKVPAGGGGEVSFGRFCSLEEIIAAPRFCKLAEVHNTWSTASEFVQSLAEDVLPGSLSIGASAVSAAVAVLQAGLKRNMTSASEDIHQLALKVTENGWDKLTGAGRLLRLSLIHI